jgi:UDP-N-acetyl-2-amino-2-deoxyglucuronate dehydrogenase
VQELFAYWQLGALHKIESEDVVNAVVRYASGATGVFQAATALWPGYTERTEFHGTKGRRSFRATSSQHGTWKMIQASRRRFRKK